MQPRHLTSACSSTPLRGLVSARNWLCDVLRVEAHFGKVAARLTRRALGQQAEERGSTNETRREICRRDCACAPFLRRIVVQ